MSKQVTCRKCRLAFVPSFRLDFYPDGEDPNVGLCERCMMAETLGPRTPNNEPSPLPPGYEEAVCKLGKGEAACSFLGMTGDGVRCLKGSAFESEIRRRRGNGSIRAMGDNFSGPPNFAVQIQPLGHRGEASTPA